MAAKITIKNLDDVIALSREEYAKKYPKREYLEMSDNQYTDEYYSKLFKEKGGIYIKLKLGQKT